MELVKTQVTLSHRTPLTATVYVGFVYPNYGRALYKPTERASIGIRFAILAWKPHFICISIVQLFMLNGGWVRASQSTWTSAIARWLPTTLFLTAAPCWKVGWGQPWLLVVPTQPNPEGCLWLRLHWGPGKALCTSDLLWETRLAAGGWSWDPSHAFCCACLWCPKLEVAAAQQTWV